MASSRKLRKLDAPSTSSPNSVDIIIDDPPDDRGHCIICCCSSFEDNHEEDEGDDKTSANWFTGNFTKFCQDMAAKTTHGGMMEVAGIVLTPQLLIAQKESSNLESPPVLVCSECKGNIDGMMEEKIKVEEMEGHVLSLQLQLLSVLRQLEIQMGQYSERMSKIENAVSSSDAADLKNRLEGDASGLENSVLQLRDAIIGVSSDLRDYQDDLSMKVDCNPGVQVDPEDDDWSNSFGVGVAVKIEVEDEETVDEHLLRQDDFYAENDDLPDAPKHHKATQTIYHIPLKGEAGTPVVFNANRKDGMSKYMREKLNRQNHPELYDPNASKPFACTKCKERFSSKHTLESHQVKKHGAPKLKCRQRGCGKLFLNSACLRVHVDNCHQNDDIKVYECDRCSAIFPSSYQLVSHRAERHSRTRACATSDDSD